ncbi:Putative oxidoreductase OrdL [Tolypocladium paradoxum]|uniref:Oxidoreductase OrdL n=1 Tax=Tolypocladium paradoxum TaxID=94208 RepID=A0A2S4L728_9HYPO|nr:Putative oxidoreductase OrdL [Tolypocladium paradoxum]
MTGCSLQDGQAELPTPNSTHSYWHRNPSRKLLGHRTTAALPPAADVVVIGSGITGTFAARELVAGGKSVVLLEAREACWGATGRVSLASLPLFCCTCFEPNRPHVRAERASQQMYPQCHVAAIWFPSQNGGHCQPGVWDSTPEVARFELATFDLLQELVAAYSIPCDWQVVGGVHAIFSHDVVRAAQEQIKRLQQYPDLRDKAVLIQDRGELTARRVPEAIAAIYQPDAAKCWPYKLVVWLLERLLVDYDASMFNLQTNTPVHHFQRYGSSWAVHTPRGEIHARDVLLATNGYTSHLLPKMTGLIIPVRGQVCALEPPGEAAQLPHSYVWLKGADHQYLIQRGPEDAQVGEEVMDRSLIFGGERLAVANGEEGISRDDELNPTLSRALHRGLNHVVKLLYSDGPDGEELHAAHEWTGIMGYSRDSSPWVGRVPSTLMSDLGAESDNGGLWISAGYTGHGMPVAARCGIAVAEMMLGKEGGVQPPKQWVASQARAAEARTAELPKKVEEILMSMPDGRGAA